MVTSRTRSRHPRVTSEARSSPHIYNIYTEALLETIGKNTVTGTSIHGCYTGLIAYADDIILISPTVNGLRDLLEHCIGYFDQTAITLNAEKTEFIKSGTSNASPFYAYIPLDGHRLVPKSSLKHLGFIWSVRKSGVVTLQNDNLEERVNKFRAVILSLIRGGIRFCTPSSIVHLFKVLAVPTLIYGLELCSLTQTQLDDLDRVGRVAVKQLFNISRYSKNYIHNIFNIDNISTCINNNKLNLLGRLMKHDSTRIVLLSSAYLQRIQYKNTRIQDQIKGSKTPGLQDHKK